jgi:hypothetical protein
MPKESGEINHIRRKREKESSNKGLFFIEIPDTVNIIDKRDQKCPEK